jgi:multidrug resistance efflux pump
MTLMLTLVVVLAAVAYVLLSQLHWRRSWKLAAVCGVVVIAGGFGPFNYLRTGNAARRPAAEPIVGRAMEIRPKVTGEVSAIPVRPGAFVKKGSIVLQIDRAPFEASIRDTTAALATAQQNIVRLKADLAAASGAVEKAQSDYNDAVWRLNQVERTPGIAAADFKMQYASDETDLRSTELRIATAREATQRKTYEAEIGPAATAVAKLVAQLNDTQLQLEQTTIRAPGDGYVDETSSAVGAHVVPTRPALTFIFADGITNRERFLANSVPKHVFVHGHGALGGKRLSSTSGGRRS